jgi:hypothetical protein
MIPPGALQRECCPPRSLMRRCRTWLPPAGDEQVCLLFAKATDMTGGTQRITAEPIPPRCGTLQRKECEMRYWHIIIAVAALAAVLLAPAHCAAQIYVADYYDGDIWRFDDAQDTLGVVINPEGPHFYYAENMSLDATGNLIICEESTVWLLDTDELTAEVLDDTTTYYYAVDAYPDAFTDDIYVIRDWGNEDPALFVLPGGEGPPVLAYAFPDTYSLRDLQVYPYPPWEGHIFILAMEYGGGEREDRSFLIDIERTGSATFERQDDIFSDPEYNVQAFGVAPEGELICLSALNGLLVYDDGGLASFGSFESYYPDKMSIGSDGTIYVTDWSYVHRVDPNGNEILPRMTGPWTPYAVVAAGFTPAAPGEDVPVNPIEGVELLFEHVVEGGYTTATITESGSRTSPRGNSVPLYADPPSGPRQDFSYVDIGSGNVYRNLIQVEVYLPGTRMFFAHASGDTFRDVTITGSIEDARGVISRFSEVVLVEDTRPNETVIAYKFGQLMKLLGAPPPIGNNYCPEGAVQHLLTYAQRAEQLFDLGMVDDAITMLSRMNGRVRESAGWCIPDTSPNNQTGEILSVSKTLMFSLGLQKGDMGPGRDKIMDAALALAVTSPARGTSWIELSAPAGETAAVRVYNASGRLVTTLFQGRVHDGRERLVWHGTDHAGEKVASGVYFILAESGSDATISKVVLVR